ncbi:MAG: polysaccharide deacetylase family protein [Candidatus Woesearchaeota archaeon]|nr:MAG: polysaccharide deacetylase family protein [Candidatus Woesearchaeota archaeon]
MKTILSVDVEGDWDSKETESLQIIPKLLDFFDDNRIKATFFAVGNLIKGNEDLFREISRKHELASHSFSHRRLDRLNLKEVEEEIVKSKKEIEKLKVKCIGFRAPFFIMHKELLQLLEKHKFVYDSSFSHSVFPGRYYNFNFRNNSKVVELPISKFMWKLPLGLSYIRLFYPLSLGFLPKKGHMYIHPYEFMKDGPGKEIPAYVRELAKVRHGAKAWKIFEQVVSKMDCEFVGCRDYLKDRKDYI